MGGNGGADQRQSYAPVKKKRNRNKESYTQSSTTKRPKVLLNISYCTTKRPALFEDSVFMTTGMFCFYGVLTFA